MLIYSHIVICFVFPLRSFVGRGGFSKLHAMQIPDYRLREWAAHLRRIVDNATCDSDDYRTANALRMARKDLKRMERYIKDNETLPHRQHPAAEKA